MIKFSEIGTTALDKAFVETIKKSIAMIFESYSKHSDSEMDLARERLIEILRN